MQLAQQVMPHLSDARSAKSSFQLAAVMSFIRKIAAATVGKERGLGSTPWDALGDSIAVLIRECGQLLPLAMEAENVVKGVCVGVWARETERLDDMFGQFLVQRLGSPGWLISKPLLPSMWRRKGSWRT